MAISKLHPIKTTLSVAIDYILNPQKTENGTLTFSYACSCSGKEAEKDFMDIRAYGTGKGNRLAWHIVQSFEGQEISVEKAHQIGIELADKLLGGKYQYVLATHNNTQNVHNHIIFNNVDMIDYRTFTYKEDRNKKCVDKLISANDFVCNENNLKVIDKDKSKDNKGKCYYEWQQDNQGKSWKSQLRHSIDEAIMQSTTFDDFLEKLKLQKIECVYTPENVIKIKFRMEGQQRYSRGKTLGWYYDEPQIRKRIAQYQLLKSGISQSTKKKSKIINTRLDVFQTSKGLLHWAEVQNMKEASKLINFLTTNQINSEQQLDDKATVVFNERMMLVSELNSSQNRLQEINEIIKLLKNYKKYKPYAEQYKTAKNQKRFEKENATELKKYSSITREMAKLFPDKVIPKVDRLEKEKVDLKEHIREKNEEYNNTVKKLQEIDEARTALNEFMKSVDRDKKQELE